MTAPDVIDVVAADWRPSRVESRAAIFAAVEAVANAHGEVHAALVRPMLPSWVNPFQIGATFCHLVRGGVLERTGEYRSNGGRKSRNGAKPSPVYRLVGALPAARAS